NAWQLSRGLRTVEERGGVFDYRALAHEEAEKTAQCRELARTRAGAEAPRDVLGHERGDGLERDVAKSNLVTCVGGEPVEIASVRFQSIPRERSLHSQVVEISVDPAFQIHAD